MMEINEFREYLLSTRAAYAAWGLYVTEEINRVLISEIGAERADSFVKIHTKPRVKGVESALGKISRKGYKNPVIEMTDLVGIRFVVLLSIDIERVSKIVTNSEHWVSSLSKDYLAERDANPKIFDYQSIHYEVRPKSEITFQGQSLTCNMCCEVQIRTLLQHAYAELVHDSVYKPVGQVPKSAERQIARSMALMETTDDLFCKTMELLEETSRERNDFLEHLTSYFKNEIGSHLLKIDLNMNYAILDEFKEFINDSSMRNIHEIFEKKKFIKRFIVQRAEYDNLFNQPSILFIYWLVSHIDSGEIISKWPLPGNISGLNMILSDLGKSTTR
ncbi:GTP pyrophosphokinase family protein [Rahnella sp. PD12R]|uniref:GTP pyrophosphokinase n=1 Tax=Rahnella sp. PD12R TaxID=2855688 RepID=UPI002106C0DD|nr:RelA/SpoT domain-containing protein [Rahnella sp. PD12R]